MSNYNLVLLIGCFLQISAHLGCQRGTVIPQRAITHSLPLELDSYEYESLLGATGLSANGDQELQRIIEVGKRNLDWVEAINGGRSKENWLLLSSRETQKNIPIEKAKEYNRETVLAGYSSSLSSLSQKQREILLGQGPLPLDPGQDDATFLAGARSINRSYQEASRWLALSPYLDGLEELRRYDIRGYFYLSRYPSLPEKLKAFSSLVIEEQNLLKGWLSSLCFNSLADETSCQRELTAALEATSDLSGFYERFLATSKSLYDSFFLLQDERREMGWVREREHEFFDVPFRFSSDPAIDRFVRVNVEDEWRGPLWNLRLFFQEALENIAHIIFVPGATPHVGGRNGTQIVMDSNSPLSDYNTQWTIRHEFGHVLGFPDCYLEFYDPARKMIISYQIDTTNLMCSRTGHLLPTHYNELKRVYHER